MVGLSVAYLVYVLVSQRVESKEYSQDASKVFQLAETTDAMKVAAMEILWVA